MITVRSKTSLGDITIDAVLRIKHGVRAQVSAYPLEEGAEISDHVRDLPQNLELVGIITPTVQSMIGQLTGDTVGGLGGVAALLSGGNRDAEGWLALKALIRRRKRLEIVTRYDTYYLLPVELLADEDAGFGKALQFTMRFVEVELGSVKSLDQIAVELRDSVGGKSGTDSFGQQTLGPPEPVPVGKAKAKPAIKNPWSSAYEVAA
jgi:hypothetical protein